MHTTGLNKKIHSPVCPQAKMQALQPWKALSRISRPRQSKTVSWLAKRGAPGSDELKQWSNAKVFGCFLKHKLHICQSINYVKFVLRFQLNKGNLKIFQIFLFLIAVMQPLFRYVQSSFLKCLFITNSQLKMCINISHTYIRSTDKTIPLLLIFYGSFKMIAV